MISGEQWAPSMAARKGARLRTSLLGRTALCGALTLVIAAGMAPRAANAGPEGTVVVGGAVDIAKTGTHTEFTQHTQTAILNHDSFDIRVNESVNFAQPNAGSLAVNRVVGSDLPSSIAGKLTANGNVWVLNPSGVAVHGTAQVNVGGLLATTASISDEAILSGQHSFAGAPEGSAITNAGSITAGEGSVVLVAPVVSNTGTITAQGSDVALGAGSGFTIDFQGDGLTRFEVTPGNGVSLSNTGVISAQGGAAYLSAASAEAVQSSVVSIGGKVEATRIEERGGVIVVTGGESGVTEVSGELDAAQATGEGGRVVVTGERVDIKGTAVLDASGAVGGGSIEIGGAFQSGAIASDVVAGAGAPETAPLPVARRTAVREGARLVADAGAQGDGGKIIVWADEATSYRGAISARGGAEGGDGGFAEVSGRQFLSFDGDVDLGAPAGAEGTLLLDPRDITIANSGGDSGEVTDNDVIDFDDGASGQDFTISDNALERAVASILLQASRDINVNTDVDASADLTFEAGRNIGIANNVMLGTTGDLMLVADAAFAGQASDGVGTITFGNGGSSLAGNDVVLTTGAAVALGDVTAAGSLAVATTNNDITQAGSLTVTGETTLMAGTGSITLGSDNNEFLGAVSASGANILLDDTTSITLADIDATGTLDVEADDDILDSNAAVAGAGIDVTGNTTLRPGTGAGDEILLNDAVNDFGSTVVVIGTPDAVTISDANTLIAGAISADNAITVGAATTVDLTGALTAPDVTIRNMTAGNGIGVGTATVDGFQLSDAELDLISGDVTIQAAGNIAADDVSAPGDATLDSSAGAVSFGGAGSSFAGALTVNAGGDVTQTAAISVTGATDVNAAGQNVTLANGANDFAAAVDVAGVDVALADADGLTLGDIDASGDLVATASTIADSGTSTAGAGVNIAGMSSLAATTTIGLDDAVNDFGGAVTAFGTDITLVDANSITLADIDAGGSLSVEAKSGTIDDGAAAGATLDVNVAGTTSLSATGAVTLDDLSNDFEGAVGGSSGAALSLADANEIQLGALTGSALTVSARDIDVANSVTIGGGDGDVRFVNSQGDHVVIGGVDAGLGADAFTLRDADLALMDFGTLTVGGGNGVTTGDTTLEAIDTSAHSDQDKNITLETDDLAVLGAVKLGSANILAIEDVTGDGMTIGNAGDDGDTDGFDLSDSDLALIEVGTLALESNGGDIAFQGFDFTTAPGTVQTLVADAADDALTTRGAVSFDAGTLAVANLTATGAGSVDQTATGAISAGAADLQTTGAVALGLAANDFGALTLTTPQNAAIRDTDGLGLGAVSVGGDLTVTAGGTITDTNGEVISVAGATSLAARDAGGTDFFDIRLDGDDGDANDRPHLFSSANSFSAAGEDISVAEADGLQLGAVTANAGDLAVDAAITGGAGTLVVLSGGPLTQSGLLTAPGRAQFLAAGNAVTLNLGNLFGGVVAAAGTGVTLRDADSIILGDIDASGNLVVTAGGTIADDNAGNAFGADIDVGGTTTLSALGAVTLDDAGTDFGGAVTVDAASLVLRDANAVRFGQLSAGAGSLSSATLTSGGAMTFGGDVRVSGSLSASAGGAIRQTGGSIAAAGAGDIATTSGAITLDDGNNDFADEGSGNVLNLQAPGVVTLVDRDSVALGTTSGTNLLVTASDLSIGGPMSFGGVVDLTNGAGAGIILGAATADLSGTTFEITDTELARIATGEVRLTTAGTGGGIELQGAQMAEALTLDAGAGGITFSTAASSVGGDLAITAGDTVDQIGAGGLTVSGTTSIDAGDAVSGFADIVLGSSNDFVGKVSASGGDIGIIDANGITLGVIDANANSDPSLNFRANEGSLVVLANGDIADTDGEKVDVEGMTRLSAGAGSVALDNGLHDFDSDSTGDEIHAFGVDITMGETGGIRLGSVSASGDLTVTAGGDIDDDGAGAVTVAGHTSLAAGGDILLDETGHDFDQGGSGDEIDATGRDIVLTDANRLVLGSVDAGRDLSVRAVAGDILDNGEGVLVTGVTTISASGDVTLDDLVNDFGGRIDAAGDDIVLSDTNSILLGDIDATRIATSSLTVRASAGTISDGAAGTAGTDVNVNGVTSLSATGGITLDDTSNDFGGRVSAAGGDISLSDATSIMLGAVSAAGDLTVRAMNGGIADSAGGVSVAGVTSLLGTGDVTLDDIINDFGGRVDAAGDNIALSDADSILLGDIDATRTATSGLAVRANSGTITDGASGAAGADVDVSGVTSLSATGNITLDDTSNDFGGRVDAIGDRIRLADRNSIILGNVDATANAVSTLSVTAGGGSITDDGSAGGDIEVRSTTILSATGAVALDTASNNFDSDAAAGSDATDRVDVTGGGAVTLTDEDAILLGAVSSTGLTVTAGGSITDTASAIDVSGATSLKAGSVGDFFDILLDGADGDPNDRPHRFSGSRAFSAEGEDITVLNSQALHLGSVTAHSAGATADLTIDAGNDGDLTVSANGSIGDTAGQAVVVSGTTSLLAGSGGSLFDIALDNADTHDFMQAVHATGEDIVLDDRNAVLLGRIDANESGEDANTAQSDGTVAFFDDNGDGVANAADGVDSAGDLTVRAGGTITETGGGIDVEGRTRLEARNGAAAFDITFDQGPHDFDSNAGPGDAQHEVDIDGAAVVLTDDSAIRLGEVSATGALSVTSAGSITDTDGETVTVGGATTLAAGSGVGDIALDNADMHDFSGTVGAFGRDIVLDDRNGISLGTVSATGDLSVAAGGSVTDTSGEAIVVNGRTVITAVDAGGTDFFDVAFDNPGLHDFNTVELTGEGIVLVDTADLTIASVKGMNDGSADPTIPGPGGIDLTVNAGDFRFEPVAGNAVPLHAGGDISLRAPGGSFAVGAERRRLQDGLTFRSGGDILLDLANGFVVQDVVGTGPFTLDAPSGTSTLRIGNPGATEFIGMGTSDFLAQAQNPSFNPLFVTASIGDTSLFEVTGDLALVAAHPLLVRIQNTSLAPNEGGGTKVVGKTLLGGGFEGLTMFGSFAGATRTTAALQGFIDLDGSFVVENTNTVNGCVILVVSSCQPIGSLSLSLDFPDGLLLGVKFLAPAEDLDDPFTNRGDEEEWE